MSLVFCFPQAVIPALCGDPLTAERQAMVRRSLAGAWTALLRRLCRQMMRWIPDRRSACASLVGDDDRWRPR
jgi:hypothetical protein